VTESALDRMHGGLVVSCQAPPGDPLRSTSTMTRLARAAEAGGAAGIRAGGPDDVRAIKQAVARPVIGLWKDGDDGVYITPTVRHAVAIAEAGADIVAVDGTRRPRPDGNPLAATIAALHGLGALVLADVATAADARDAVSAGADAVATTLSGYTADSPHQDGPDLELLATLAAELAVPVIAEGRYHTPELARRALAAGAHAVVVGAAITSPAWLTAQFAAALDRPPSR
jgi:N-acylglucosamine-6-phosphate 2-epimerase